MELSVEPVPDDSYQITGLAVVSFNILTCYVGDELLVPVSLPIHDQAGFCLLYGNTKPLRAQENAEFERHIESR